jgi:hypothetical protein
MDVNADPLKRSPSTARFPPLIVKSGEPSTPATLAKPLRLRDTTAVLAFSASGIEEVPVYRVDKDQRAGGRRAPRKRRRRFLVRYPGDALAEHTLDCDSVRQYCGHISLNQRPGVRRFDKCSA